MLLARLPAASRRRAALAALLCVAATTAACSRDEITHARVPKRPAALTSTAPPSGDVPGAGAGPMSDAGGGAVASRARGADGAGSPASRRASGGGLRWTLPRGWTEQIVGGMRYATLKPAVSGKIDASVVVLPGPAGGELANVNRWRNQLGLPPIDEPALASARKTVKAPAGEIAVYDFTSEGGKARTVAGFTAVDGNSWFVKLTGDADPVAAARPDFLKVLESLRRE